MKISKCWKKRCLLSGLLLLAVTLIGCSAGNQSEKSERTVIVPEASGREQLETEDLLIDISHLELGYLMAKYTGNAERLFLQLLGPEGTEYKYFFEPSDRYVTIPFSEGEGDYFLCAYEKVGEDRYSPILSQSLQIELENEFGPFLCSNQYVDFSMEDEAVRQAEQMTESLTADLEKVQTIYGWVTQNIAYDYEKAVEVSTGYLPDIDATFRTERGICFDYAALMTAMLRSLGIPTKLEIGYLTEEIYHSWISVYLEEIGWVDQMIEFNGKDWELMDPTIAAASGSQEVEEMAEDEAHYIVRYVR